MLSKEARSQAEYKVANGKLDPYGRKSDRKNAERKQKKNLNKMVNFIFRFAK